MVVVRAQIESRKPTRATVVGLVDDVGAGGGGWDTGGAGGGAGSVFVMGISEHEDAITAARQIESRRAVITLS